VGFTEGGVIGMEKGAIHLDKREKISAGVDDGNTHRHSEFLSLGDRRGESLLDICCRKRRGGLRRGRKFGADGAQERDQGYRERSHGSPPMKQFPAWRLDGGRRGLLQDLRGRSTSRCRYGRRQRHPVLS